MCYFDAGTEVVRYPFVPLFLILILGKKTTTVKSERTFLFPKSKRNLPLTYSWDLSKMTTYNEIFWGDTLKFHPLVVFSIIFWGDTA